MNSSGRKGSWRHDVSSHLTIPWGHAVIDLSNLVFKATGINSTRVQTQEPSMVSRRLRKPRERKQLYPTERMIQSTDDFIFDTTEKRKNKVSHLLLEQHSSFTRRTKGGAMTTYSTRDYQVETLGPGAYEFIPEVQEEDRKPPPTAGVSKFRNNTSSEYEPAPQGYNNSSFDDDSQGPESEQPARTNLQIEISPGVFVRLRGSEETWSAIQSGNSTHATCYSCELSLLCIADAEYVICPACRVVSPLSTGSYGQPSNPACTTGGVGLGMQAY